MNLFSIDKELCKRDGRCVEECPTRIIEFSNISGQNATPHLSTKIPNGEEICIRCGHCVAICPVGAFRHCDIDIEHCPEVQKELHFSSDHVEHFLRSRRSIRSYKKEPVPRESIERLIEIARYAPSGHNMQPVKWKVIYDPEHLQVLAGYVIDFMRSMVKKSPEFAASMHFDLVIQSWEEGLDRVCRHAPHCIITHGQKENAIAQSASTIALTYLDLAAPSIGLGTCWAGYFNVAAMLWKPMKAELDLPEGHTAFGSMLIGIPKYNYRRLIQRKPPTITWK